eukprot:4326014-Amphidinium_carterae.2
MEKPKCVHGMLQQVGGAQRRYQKIDLSTSLMFFRRMTPQNDVFKQHRCDAIVEVFKDMTDDQRGSSM